MKKVFKSFFHYIIIILIILKYNHPSPNDWSKSVILRVQIANKEDHPALWARAPSVFEHEVFLFNVNENWSGFVDRVRARLNKRSVEEDLIVYSLELNSIDQKQTLNEHFELRNSNEIYLKKEFDFERGERGFNFSLVAYNHKHDDSNSESNDFTLDSMRSTPKLK